MEIPFNLLILPFLGGYVFIRCWNVTRIFILRADKDRIIIRSALTGLILTFIAYAITIFYPQYFPCVEGRFCIQRWWEVNVPFEYSGVSFIAFWLGALGWLPLNLFWRRQAAVNRAIRVDADPLEGVLKRSKDETLSLAITMANDKVYIGFVTHQFNPVLPTNFISMIPLQSGYR
ncbi:MAG: hypothetical protein JO053_07155, partial [Acidobacteria bacterium]|nr:hypothetical protein [Acidobacteriota bacterium]